ncbi:TY1 enhancer activator [Fusarium heterosporum]|uniref:TY1 enhancer activator n=1 Tax=Fusarium heterosporum TaxID=42747 RepID=A0A8H5SYT3_FUSHE|nr:TY1 enhancer activator [Fusarium heterosporum]
MSDDTVFKALQQFFRWQYPHFMFIYREAFLRDHFGDRKDKLISLVLGRPVQLPFESAEVDLLKFIPDGPEMEYWRPVGINDEPNETLGTSNIPYLKEQIRLYVIVEKMMTSIFSPKTPKTESDISTRQSTLDSLNLELIKWRDSLPLFAKWNKWSTSDSITPALVTLQ